MAPNQPPNPVDRVRENRIRRMIDRQGYALRKCRRRDQRAIGFGTYQIVDTNTGKVIASGYSLDDAERWALGEPVRMEL
jgi:hypothetical protein